MFGSRVFEIGIGLTLVFLLVSIVAMAMQEGLEGILRHRAGDLETALGALLQGDAQAMARFHAHPLVFALYRDGERPSYIPRAVFSAAITDMAASGERLPDRLRGAYDVLDRLSGGNAARRRRELEAWYDAAMDRASGWFRRRTQRMLFLTSLGGAVLLNVNAVTIAQYLNANDVQRMQVIGLAQSVPDDAPATVLHARLAEIGLPIGWSAPARRWMMPAADDRIAAGMLVAAGWLITALAAMLGAPFWFDVLGRMMVVRSTMKPGARPAG